MPRWEDQVLDEYRRPVPGAFVHVFSNDDKARMALTDDSGLPLDNPVETDAFGSFYFNVAATGIYQLEIHYAGETEYKQTINIGSVDVPDGAVDTGKLADGAVTTIKLADNAVTMAKLADVAGGTVFYRKSAGAGDPETQPLATLKADLGLAGNNSGDQIITLTGDVTGNGTGNINAQIAANAVGAPELAAGAVESKLGYVPAADTIFTASVKGLAPASGGGVANFLCANGTWAVPPGTAVSAVWGAITGVLSNQTDLQAALDGKAPTVHVHTIANVTGLQGALDAKADDTDLAAYSLTSHNHAGVYAPLVHTHIIGDVTGLQAALDSKAGTALVSTSAAGLAPTRPGGTAAFLRADGTWAVPPDTTGGAPAWGTITGVLSAQADLQTALDAKAALAGATFTGAVNVPDVAYGLGWNGSVAVPTRNAVYDQMEILNTALVAKADASALALKVDKTFAGTNTVQATGAAGKVVMEQTVGTYGPTRLTVQSIAGCHGALFESAPGGINLELVDFSFQTPSGGTSTIRYERRAAQIAAVNAWEFQIGNSAGTPENRLGNAGCNFVGKVNVGFASNQAFGANTFSVNGNAYFNGSITLADEAYAAAWDAKLEAPTKNAVYDKIQAVIATIPAATTSIVGITGTIAQFNTACTDADFATASALAAKADTSALASYLPLTGGTLSGGLIANAYVRANATDNFIGPNIGAPVQDGITHLCSRSTSHTLQAEIYDSGGTPGAAYGFLGFYDGLGSILNVQGARIHRIRCNNADVVQISSTGMDLAAGMALSVAATKVVGARGAAIANAAAGTEIATINAILAALRTHGLIA